MKNRRVVLNSAGIRRHNTFLKNWANRTESDDLAELILAGIISARNGHSVLKGVKV